MSATASSDVRCRPHIVYSRTTVEVVRTVDLVSKSALLNIYKASQTQHAFCDSYIIEQHGRLIQHGLGEAKYLDLLKFTTQPDFLICLRISAHRALERMIARLKGDSLL